MAHAAGRALRQLMCRQQQQHPQAALEALLAHGNGACSRLAAAAGASASSGSGSARGLSAYARSTGGSTAASGKGFRRVNPSSGSGGSAAAADAAAAVSTSGQAGGSVLEMSQEVPGGSKPLLSWERWYWFAGVGGLSFFLYGRLKKPDKTPEELEEEQRKIEELRQRRKDHVRSVLMSQNFLEGESDPLDGLSPAQIVMFMEKYGIDPTDPLEGLTPEEIDAYMQQQEAKKLQQESGQAEQQEPEPKQQQ